MDKDTNIKFGEFDAEIGADGKVVFEDKLLFKLLDKGINKIKLELYVSAMELLKIDPTKEKLFFNIKKIQSLPDSVVLDFIDSKGKLRSNKIKIIDG